MKYDFCNFLDQSALNEELSSYTNEKTSRQLLNGLKSVCKKMDALMQTVAEEVNSPGSQTPTRARGTPLEINTEWQKYLKGNAVQAWAPHTHIEWHDNYKDTIPPLIEDLKKK